MYHLIISIYFLPLPKKQKKKQNEKQKHTHKQQKMKKRQTKKLRNTWNTIFKKQQKQTNRKDACVFPSTEMDENSIGESCTPLATVDCERIAPHIRCFV
mmetsp:Transcript_64895/g.75469  ORF Transcript_64895/g.75469 Transcript_64895/m.75469 type:complete len:99 (-) Transcript_64895:43-339(-)